MPDIAERVIVGAGPYGLSLAAHLRHRHVPVRVFGQPMSAWEQAMPAGMMLKSEPFASSLSDPGGRFTLERFCTSNGLDYSDVGTPVPLERFVEYGRDFQRRCVPHLERREVHRLARDAEGFALSLDDRSVLRARSVVVAAGIRAFAHIPECLRHLPRERLSHSADYGRETPPPEGHVLVIGSGASAMDVAAWVRRNGCSVAVLARRPHVAFQTSLSQRTPWQRLKAPMTPVGPGWKAVLCTRMPLLFHVMPAAFRTSVVRRFLGPAPGWAVREQVEGRIPIVTGATLRTVEQRAGRLRVSIETHAGEFADLDADHIIAATGYRVDMRRLSFLDGSVRQALALCDNAPVLSRNFESSISGLYFIGPTAANSFGPMMRFVCGAGFAARRVARHLSRVPARRPSSEQPRADSAPLAAPR